MYDCRVILDDDIEAALRSRFPGRRMGDAVRRALHEWIDVGGTEDRIVTSKKDLSQIIKEAMRRL